MAAWLIPALKAILPLVSPIVASALPVFTTRKPDAPAQDPIRTQQQIAELQAATSQNSLHIKELAEQLQRTVAALEADAAAAEARFRRVRRLGGAAFALSLLAVGLALVSLLGN